MIIERSMHPEWLSNAYLVADHPGGSAICVDAGAPIDVLLARARVLRVRVSHVLLTHDHHDHVMHASELQDLVGAQIVTAAEAEHGLELQSGSLTLRARSTPGHCSPHVAWEVSAGAPAAAPTVIFTGDVLFRETVGGTRGGGPDSLSLLRASVLGLLHDYPASTVLYPGHAAATSVEHELAHNPFVRAWNADAPVDGEPVRVAGQPATPLLEAGDYDGTTKAWVRFCDGGEAVVGGSLLSRPQPDAS